jgi:hypothetical protein
MDAESYALIQAASNQLHLVEAVAIATPEEAQGAVDQIAQIKGLAKKIVNHRLSKTKPLDEDKEKIMDFFRPAVEWLDKAEALLKNAVNVFNAEQRKRQAEAEAERRRLETEERERQAEAQRQAEALLVQAEDAAPEQAEVLEAQAEALQEVAKPLALPVTFIPEKTKGASTRQNWKFRIVDPAYIPREYLMIDEKKLGAYAKAMKASASVPGVEFYPEDVLAVRSA